VSDAGGDATTGAEIDDGFAFGSSADRGKKLLAGYVGVEVSGGATAEGVEDGGLVLDVAENHHRHICAGACGFAARRVGGNEDNRGAELAGEVGLAGRCPLYCDVVRVLGEKSQQVGGEVRSRLDDEHDDRGGRALRRRGRWQLNRAHNTDTPEGTWRYAGLVLDRQSAPATRFFPRVGDLSQSSEG
jgi:hypothetical protein